MNILSTYSELISLSTLHIRLCCGHFERDRGESHDVKPLACLVPIPLQMVGGYFGTAL